jgi:hypothetical protein
MTSPVFEALVRARHAQLNKSEAQISEQVDATLGPRPPDTHRPARFIRFCEDQSLPWRPAAPAVVAAFVLGHSKLGNCLEEIRSISAAHCSQDIPDPTPCRQVAEALLRLSDIKPPRSWPAAERTIFMQLPRDLQAYLIPREAERDKIIRRAQNEAAEARKAIQKPTEATNGTIEKHETLAEA